MNSQQDCHKEKMKSEANTPVLVLHFRNRDYPSLNKWTSASFCSCVNLSVIFVIEISSDTIFQRAYNVI